MFKRILIAAALLTAPALADDAKPAAPTCGATATECAKVLGAQIDTLTKAYQAVRQQRDQTQQALSDLQVQEYLDQQAKVVPAK